VSRLQQIGFSILCYSLITTATMAQDTVPNHKKQTKAPSSIKVQVSRELVRQVEKKNCTQWIDPEKGFVEKCDETETFVEKDPSNDTDISSPVEFHVEPQTEEVLVPQPILGEDFSDLFLPAWLETTIFAEKPVNRLSQKLDYSSLFIPAQEQTLGLAEKPVTRLNQKLLAQDTELASLYIPVQTQTITPAEKPVTYLRQKHVVENKDLDSLYIPIQSQRSHLLVAQEPEKSGMTNIMTASGKRQSPNPPNRIKRFFKHFWGKMTGIFKRPSAPGRPNPGQP